MSAYEFTTIWRVQAPLEVVWNEIYHSELWPSWWRGVEAVVKVRDGDEFGVGAIQRYTWKSKLPYRLSFEMEVVRIETAVTVGRNSQRGIAGTRSLAANQ